MNQMLCSRQPNNSDQLMDYLRKVNIPAFTYFSVFVFVCLFVSVFELTRVHTYTEITYVPKLLTTVFTQCL